MRIAFGGYHIECSTYNPVLTREADFTVYRGEALLKAPSFRFLAELRCRIPADAPCPGRAGRPDRARDL